MRTRTAETVDPQIAVVSREETPGGPDLRVLVQSLGQGAASADLLLAFDAAADYDAAAGFSRTNALRTVSAAGALDLAAHGLRPGTAYVAALVATNAAGGAGTVDLGSFSTPSESHGAADSGLDAEPAWTVGTWSDGADSFSDNLLRADRGTLVLWGSKGSFNNAWNPSYNTGFGIADMNDGAVHTTDYGWGQGFGPGDQRVVCFELAEPVALKGVKLFARYIDTRHSRIGVEGVDVRSSWNDEWTTIPGSAVLGGETGSGQTAALAAAGNDWLARDVTQIRFRCSTNTASGYYTIYHEMEAFGVPEADAPAPGSQPGRGRPLSAGAAILTTDGFSGTVVAPAGEPAFPEVWAVWGATYGGEDTNAWENALPLGSMSTDAASLGALIPAADLGGAAYVRYAAFGADGSVSWSDSVYVPDLAVQDSLPPVVAFGAVSDVAASSVKLSANVVYAGSSSLDGLVDLTLECTLDPDGFAEGSQATVETFDFATGAPLGLTAATTVSPLRAARRYYARFVGENEAGRTGYGDVFTFDTAAEGGGSSTSSNAGLIQVWGPSGSAVSGGWQNFVYPDDVGANFIVYTNRVGAYLSRLGTEAPLTRWTDEYGNTYTWPNSANPLVYYQGVMKVEAGRTYRFWDNNWDNSRFWIDGNLLWASGSGSGNYTATEDGYVPIKLWEWGGSGRLGCQPGWVSSFFWTTAYTTGGPSQQGGNGWNLLENPEGEPAYLFAAQPARAVAITSARVDGGAVDVAASVSEGAVPGTAWVVWGATDAGTGSLDDWTGRQSLGTVSEAAQTIQETGLAIDPALTPVVRVVVSDDIGDNWSAPVLLGSALDPVIGPATADADGDTLAVEGGMLSTGSGSGFALRLLVGYGADAAATATNDVAVAQDGSFSIDAEVLPGTNGWWRLVARTSDGGYDATLPAAFATKAGSVLKPSASATVQHHTATVSAALDVLGAGVTTATVWESADGETGWTAVEGSDRILTKEGAFQLTATFPGAPHALYWKVVAVNVAPGGTAWTNETAVGGPLSTLDQGTYTWDPTVPEGIWNDSGNWIVSDVDAADCIGYPDSPQAKVRFVEGTTARIEVDGAFVFENMSLKYADLDVTFAGTNAATCELRGDIQNVANDANDATPVSNARIVLSGVTAYDSSGAFNWATRVSTNCVLRLENGAVLSMDGYMHVFGTNTWVEVADGSTMVWRRLNTDSVGFDFCNYGGGLAVDDATFSTSWLTPQRHVRSAGEPQFVRISGAAPRLQVGYSFRTYSNSEDWMTNDVRFAFAVPQGGYGDYARAPVYAGYVGGGADSRKLGWRDAGAVNGGKVVFQVDPSSPAFRSGRHLKRVQLVSWLAGIDEKSVRLENSTTATGVVWSRLFYTYGWPSTATEPSFPGEAPTGVAAEIIGQGGTFLIFR